MSFASARLTPMRQNSRTASIYSPSLSIATSISTPFHTGSSAKQEMKARYDYLLRKEQKMQADMDDCNKHWTSAKSKQVSIKDDDDILKEEIRKLTIEQATIQATINQKELQLKSNASEHGTLEKVADRYQTQHHHLKDQKNDVTNEMELLKCKLDAISTPEELQQDDVVIEWSLYKLPLIRSRLAQRYGVTELNDVVMFSLSPSTLRKLWDEMSEGQFGLNVDMNHDKFMAPQGRLTAWNRFHNRYNHFALRTAIIDILKIPELPHIPEQNEE